MPVSAIVVRTAASAATVARGAVNAGVVATVRSVWIFLLTVRMAGASDLGSLYHAHQWAELREAVRAQKSPVVYRGIVAAVYGDDRRAERILQGVIRTAPESDDAYEAYEWLTHIYFRTGQYSRLIANMEARWAAFPKKSEIPTERHVMAGFRGLPDQTAGKV